MATPATLQSYARRALIARAKDDAGLTALVPVASIEPPAELVAADGGPIWPFIIFRSPTTGRLNAACVKGAVATFDAHVFARERRVSGGIAETGYDHCSRIAAALEGALADNRLTLENGATCRIRLSDAQMLQESAPHDWHWFGQVNCRVLSAPFT